jgi:hypothetical protein
MIIYDGQNKELMTVRKFERDGNDLVVMGKIFGAMPVKARLKPEEARAALKLLTPGLIWFLVTLRTMPRARRRRPESRVCPRWNLLRSDHRNNHNTV